MILYENNKIEDAIKIFDNCSKNKIYRIDDCLNFLGCCYSIQVKKQKQKK